MDQQHYERVDLSRIAADGPSEGEAVAAGPASEPMDTKSIGRFRWSIVPLSILLCTAQAGMTVLVGHSPQQVLFTATLITVLAFAVLMLMTLVLNPVLRRVFRGVVLRPLNRVELTAVFTAMLVTSGISTFGLTDQVIPLVAAPYNPEWNTPQSEWDTRVIPHLQSRLYLVVPEAPAPGDLETAREAVGAFEQQMSAAAAPAAGLSPAQRDEALAAADLVRRVLFGGGAQPAELDASLQTMRSALAEMGALDIEAFAGAVSVTARRAAAYNSGADVIRFFRQGSSVANLRQPQPGATWGAWWDYYSALFQRVPWGSWLAPLGFWLIFFFACYGMFYSLTYVVLDYWTRREKLIFPLAKLPEALLPRPGRGGWVPEAFRDSGFWIGFALSFVVLSYNAAANAQWLPGFTPVGLGLSYTVIEGMFKDNFLEGLIGYSGWHTSALIIFTAVGLAFFLPTEVSFSIWFYFLLAKMMILSATWMGHGRTGADMPADWLWQTNMVTSLGAGGIILFSAVSLYRCISEFVRAALDRRAVNRLKLMAPMIGLVICTTVVIGWVWWNWNWTPESLIWAVVFASFLVLLTLGLMRIVAEGGVYWIQVNGGSFFHFYKALGLGHVFKPMLLGPLMPIYATLFLDIKTFMAPNLLNAARMREDVGGSRFKFHLNLMLCIVISVVVSFGVALMLTHDKGANHMHGWFYTSFPVVVMDKMKTSVSTEPKFEPTDTAWYGAGAGWVAFTMFIRRSLFWFPHPIGFIMLINPLISAMWFSFFLGWSAKAMVVKYGGKVTFDRVRLAFIGLIMGELLAVVIWPLIGIAAGVSVGNISLNR